MTAAKKVAAKKPVAKPAAKKAPAAKKPVEQEIVHNMPKEVSEWIERASSTMKHLQNQVATLKEENAQLKAYKKFAEGRILRSDHD